MICVKIINLPKTQSQRVLVLKFVVVYLMIFWTGSNRSELDLQEKKNLKWNWWSVCSLNYHIMLAKGQ